MTGPALSSALTTARIQCYVLARIILILPRSEILPARPLGSQDGIYQKDFEAHDLDARPDGRRT